MHHISVAYRTLALMAENYRIRGIFRRLKPNLRAAKHNFARVIQPHKQFRNSQHVTPFAQIYSKNAWRVIFFSEYVATTERRCSDDIAHLIDSPD
jgi:hypothetical protein